MVFAETGKGRSKVDSDAFHLQLATRVELRSQDVLIFSQMFQMGRLLDGVGSADCGIWATSIHALAGLVPPLPDLFETVEMRFGPLLLGPVNYREVIPKGIIRVRKRLFQPLVIVTGSLLQRLLRGGSLRGVLLCCAKAL